MSIAAPFSSSMTRCPRPFDPETGRDIRALFTDLPPDMQELIEGAAGSSPHVQALCQTQQEWLRTALHTPEDSFTALLETIPATPLDQVAPALRLAKKRAGLLIALADLAGVWSLEDVTTRLTQFADLAVDLALKSAILPQLRRGKLPGLGEEAVGDAAGMVVLAMGKMGAGELNYSSDIDLICLFDETRFAPDDYDTVRGAFVKATRAMSACLNDHTADGYVFRTDLRLRPDPSVTPVCMAMARAEAYYESLGRTWERAAYIKARACAGDVAAGERFLDGLKPFVWRRHLDFAAIEDAHNMRLRIREHKGVRRQIALPGHNIKLGRGGIREIEFFAQTQQLISGGRDPDLRSRGTVAALAKLAKKDWIPVSAAEDLTDHYRFHREIEHRLQMVHDAQTQDLPGSDAGFERLACLTGTECDALQRDLLDRLTAVHRITEGFFAPSMSDASTAPAPVAELDESILARWESYPALRSARALEIFKRLKPEILTRLAKAVDPADALLAFDGFLAGLPAGVQVFSMFEARPQLLDLLVDIAGTAPRLAHYLSRNAAVFDAVIGGHFFAHWPGQAALEQDLSGQLARESDYERKLDLSRRWGKELHFRIGVHHLRGLITAQEAGAMYADLAQATVAALWPEVQAHFATKHGSPPGRGAVVLGMGSLGARQLNASSDLDLIVIYDAGDSDTSEGRRPLPARTYYARLTQSLITALTAQMSDGRLYEVDMRLRPSGNQGPVATSWSAFQSYQNQDAWVWEHLALTRARVIAGPPELGRDVEAFRLALLADKGGKDRVLPGVADMRARLASAKPPDGPWDVKLGPGRIQDIELIAQAATLMSAAPGRDILAGLQAGQDSGWMKPTQMATLKEAHDLARRILQVTRLLGDDQLDTRTLGSGGLALLLRETDHNTAEELQIALDEACQAAADAIRELLHGYEDAHEGP